MKRPDPKRLRILADYFDVLDARGILDGCSKEVQEDLRQWANYVDMEDRRELERSERENAIVIQLQQLNCRVVGKIRTKENT